MADEPHYTTPGDRFKYGTRRIRPVDGTRRSARLAAATARETFFREHGYVPSNFRLGDERIRRDTPTALDDPPGLDYSDRATKLASQRRWITGHALAADYVDANRDLDFEGANDPYIVASYPTFAELAAAASVPGTPVRSPLSVLASMASSPRSARSTPSSLWRSPPILTPSPSASRSRSRGRANTPTRYMTPRSRSLSVPVSSRLNRFNRPRNRSLSSRRSASTTYHSLSPGPRRSRTRSQTPRRSSRSTSRRRSRSLGPTAGRSRAPVQTAPAQPQPGLGTRLYNNWVAPIANRHALSMLNRYPGYYSNPTWFGLGPQPLSWRDAISFGMDAYYPGAGLPTRAAFDLLVDPAFKTGSAWLNQYYPDPNLTQGIRRANYLKPASVEVPGSTLLGRIFEQTIKPGFTEFANSISAATANAMGAPYEGQSNAAEGMTNSLLHTQPNPPYPIPDIYKFPPLKNEL